MATITPRKSGGYRIRGRIAGKAVEFYAPTKPAARALLESRFGPQATPPAARSAARFGDKLSEYIGLLRIKESTRDGYRSLARVHLSGTRLWGMRVDRVEVADLLQVIHAMEEAGYAAGTVNRLVMLLHTFYRRAVREGLVPADPLDKLDREDLPANRTHRPVLHPLTRQESLDLVAYMRAAGDPYAPLVSLAVATGMRKGEVMGLRWANVLDLDGPQPRVQVQATLRPGAAGQLIPTPKTQKSHRTILLPPQAAADLRAHRVRWAEARMAAGDAWAVRAEADDFVFTREGGRPASFTTVQKTLARALDASGVGARRMARLGPDTPGLRFHDLRHGYATHALEAGIPMERVSRQLGHASYAITADVYMAWSTESQDQVAAVMAALGY